MKKEIIMIRNLVCTFVALGLIGGVAAADEFLAVLKKVEGNKVTYIKAKMGEKEETTLPAAADIKVLYGKFNTETKKTEPGDTIDGGLKNEAFKDLGKGKYALVITDGANSKITEIRVL